jgi:mitogen-activated protein kinase 1/3
MEIEESTPKNPNQGINPQSQSHDNTSKSQQNPNNVQNNNQTQFQQTQKIELDPKAVEMLKKYQKNYPIKEYTYNDEVLHLPTRYKPGEIIGIGAYGIIISAVDLGNNNQVVAIKKLKRISDIIDLKRIAREILIMKYCQHENIIPLLDVIIHLNKDKNMNKVADVYLVMEKMDSDLQKIIASKQELSDEHYQFILYQMLRALYFLHSANIIHRDFKPSNVLINEDCTVKLCDFGMSRGIKEENALLTEYVVTRYYRAPEVMLSSHHYTKKIDVWSVGCAFAELLSKKFMFPGDNYIAQIKLIIDVLGTQDLKDLDFISNSSAKSFVMQFQNIPKKNFREILNCENPLAVDLVEKMLVFNPDKRYSIEDCLNHPYLKNMREGIEDPVFNGKINLDFDDKNITFSLFFVFLVKEISSFPTGLVVA